MWRSSRARMLLDGGIVSVSTLLLFWLTSLHEVFASAAGTGLVGVLVLIAYQVADAASVAIILSTASRSRQLGPALLIVSAGIASFVLSDGLFIYLRVSHPNVLDAGYVLGFLAFAAASRTAPSAEPATANGELARWQVLLPYGWLAAMSPGIILYVIRHHTLDPFG